LSFSNGVGVDGIRRSGVNVKEAGQRTPDGMLTLEVIAEKKKSAPQSASSFIWYQCACFGRFRSVIDVSPQLIAVAEPPDFEASQLNTSDDEFLFSPSAPWTLGSSLQ